MFYRKITVDNNTESHIRRLGGDKNQRRIRDYVQILTKRIVHHDKLFS